MTCMLLRRRGVPYWCDYWLTPKSRLTPFIITLLKIYTLIWLKLKFFICTNNKFFVKPFRIVSFFMDFIMVVSSGLNFIVLENWRIKLSTGGVFPSFLPFFLYRNVKDNGPKNLSVTERVRDLDCSSPRMVPTISKGR